MGECDRKAKQACIPHVSNGSVDLTLCIAKLNHRSSSRIYIHVYFILSNIISKKRKNENYIFSLPSSSKREGEILISTL